MVTKCLLTSPLRSPRNLPKLLREAYPFPQLIKPKISLLLCAKLLPCRVATHISKQYTKPQPERVEFTVREQEIQIQQHPAIHDKNILTHPVLYRYLLSTIATAGKGCRKYKSRYLKRHRD